MKILTAKQMTRWDKLSIGRSSKTARHLMKHAAQACTEVLISKSQEAQNPALNLKVVVVCGPGNNGGDGLAMAGFLKERGFKTEVFLLGDRARLSSEAQYFYKILEKRYKVKVNKINTNIDLLKIKLSLKSTNWLVDALFGIGLNRKISGLYKQAILWMNQAKAQKLAVDIPSGISGDTGEILGTCFRTDYTVTFEAPKWGHVIETAWDAVGELIVKPIGLKKTFLKNFVTSAQWLEESTVRPWFKKRPKAWHKGRGGRALILAGSKAMPGAGYLSSLGALRSGAGLVHWVLPEGILEKLTFEVPEVILDFLPTAKGEETFSPLGIFELKEKILPFQALALGPGWGNNPSTQKFLQACLIQILKRNSLPYVLDADALNALAEQKKLYPLIKGAILTPHPREMARLLGKTLPITLEARIKTVRQFAKCHRIYLILKSYRSILATPQGEVWLNSAGGPNLAVAGSGDVLTGILTGLLAQGYKPKQAMLAGAWIHGRAGDLLAKQKGDRGTLASEVARKVPEVIAQLLKMEIHR